MNALITGASSGIGETIARRLAAAGHQAALMARRGERVQALATELGRAIAVPGDVGIAEDCETSVGAAVEAFGSLDALVNAAGNWVEEPLAEVGYEDLRAFVETDVSGALQITRAALPMLMQSGGRILHINGLQGLIRARPPVLYAAVESAVRGLCESLRWEAAAQGVHVSLITLGAVASPAPVPVYGGGQRCRLSRDEVADAVCFVLAQPHGVNVDELVLTPLGQKWWFCVCPVKLHCFSLPQYSTCSKATALTTCP